MIKNALLIIENISLIGGTEKAIIGLAKILISTEQFNVSILSIKSVEENKIYAIPIGVNIIHLGCNSRFLKKYSIIKKKIDELRQSSEINYLISSGHNFSCFLLPFYSKKIKCIAYEHINRNMISRKMRLFQRLLYPKLYKIVVLTPKEKKQYAFLKDKVYIIPNFIDDFCVKRTAIRNLILAVGRLEYIKGFDILIRALASIKNSLNGWEVRICGNGSLRNELQSLINELKLDEIVSLVPAHDLYEDYSSARLFVLSSREEAFGLALIEAMQSGIPCIAFRSSGPDFILQNDEDILINQNEEILAKKILKFISDKTLSEKICKRQNEYLQSFSFEKIKELWLGQIFC